MNAIKTVFTFALASFLAVSAEAATTFAELNAEIAAAASGSTVYVENDMDFDGALANLDGKTITIAGKDGVAYTLTRASGYAAGTFFSVSGTATRKLIIKDLVVDFNCPSNEVKLANRAFAIESDNGSLTLESGAKLCNAYQTGSYAGFICVTKGKVIMEEGSEISNIRHDGYACALLVGNNSAGVFVMNGGLITDCHDVTPSGKTDDYGGIVYVYGGQFVFNGGAIVGNTSKHYNAGVFLSPGSKGNSGSEGGYGSVIVGGHGVITGNVGKVSNDIYCYNGYWNVWIVNNTGSAPSAVKSYAMLYDGATMTVKSKTDNYEKCCALPSSCSSFSGIGNVSQQDDPMLVCNETDINKYYPKWVKKTAEARTADRLYVRPSLTNLFNLVKGKTARITLFDDVTWDRTSPYDPSKNTDWVISSADAADRHTIKMPNSATGFLSLSAEQNYPRKIRLENIIIDGNAAGAEMAASGGLFYLAGGANLELGRGAVITNVYSNSGGSGGSAIRAIGSAQVRMEEGAEISDCRGVWGVALLLGNSSTSSATTFNMLGGRITNCRCTGSSDGSGGTIYLWGATMNMSGGEITGNVSPNGGTAGLHLENGSKATLNLSGTARIHGNTGPHPDVYKRDNNTITFSGDFRGLIGIAGVDSAKKDIVAAEGATGAWCFYQSQTDGVPNGKWGYVESGTFKWGDPVGTVDGYGFVLPSDIDVRLGDAEDLSTPELRAAALPHALTGQALNANITQTLTFDSKELLNSGELPLCLYTGDFTGSVNVTTPVEGKLRWRVTKKTVNDVCGLYLERDPYGMALIIR